MPILIDTYNVLHVVGVLPPELAGIDVLGLMDLIGTSRYRSEPAILVCDGSPPPAGPPPAAGPIELRYAGGGTTADDLIASLVEASSDPRRLLVVSSDRAVLRSGRRRRCRTLSSEAFLRHLAADRLDAVDQETVAAPPPDGLTPEDVEAWEAAFEDGGEEPTGPDPWEQIRRNVTPPGPGDDRVPGEDTPDRPPLPLPTAPTVLPADLLAEAEALIVADVEAAEADRRERERAAADRRQAERSPDPTAEPAPAPDLGAMLPEQLLAEAEHLAGLGTEGLPRDVTPADEQDDHPPDPPARPADVGLTDDIIAEAEAEWQRGLLDDIDTDGPVDAHGDAVDDDDEQTA
jgi:hypothetical protein